MKKVSFTVIFLLSFVSCILAQNFTLGVKGGYLYSDMSVHNVEQMKSKAKNGYLVGIFTRIGGQQWYFQPELHYRVRTAEFEKTVDAVRGNVEVDYKTIDMPLQLGVNLINLHLLKLSVHTGPVASIKIGEKTEFKNVAGKLEDYVKDYNFVLWAGQIGLTADISKFVVDLSYEKGFSDVAKAGAGKNDLFMVTIGFKLF